MFKCCSHGTLLHFGLQSSRLNICYYHQDLHLWQLDSGPRPKLQRLPQRPSYSAQHDLIKLPCRSSIGSQRFSAIHFQDWLIRQVSCYTLLGGFRLPWPPSCCLNEPTPFMGSHERIVWRFNIAFGSSRIAIAAYRPWPTNNFHSRSNFS